MTTTTPTVAAGGRLVDLLCPNHRAEILSSYWTPPGDLSTFAAWCATCHDALQRQMDATGWYARIYAGWAGQDILRLGAAHEAAHAVAGLRVGVDVEYMFLTARGDGSCYYSSSAGIPSVADQMTFVWAGEAGTLRFLDAESLNTSTNILDVRLGTHADVRQLADLATTHGCDITTGRTDAARLVAQEWDTITRLAAALVQHRALARHEIRTIVGNTTGRT